MGTHSVSSVHEDAHARMGMHRRHNKYLCPQFHAILCCRVGTMTQQEIWQNTDKGSEEDDCKLAHMDVNNAGDD